MTPEHWLSRADEARAIADQMNDPTAKRAMLNIAVQYERLARHAALSAAQKEQSKQENPD